MPSLPSSDTFTAGDAGTHRFIRDAGYGRARSRSPRPTRRPRASWDAESGIVVQAAAAQTLAVTGFPTSETAGTPGSVTVTAYDAYGNVATGYTGTVALTSTDAHAGLPPDYTFTTSDAGQYSFTLTLDTAGTQSITATDAVTPSLTASESGIAVQAAAAKTLAVTGFPTSERAGVPGIVTVTAYDAYGNIATGYTGSVALRQQRPGRRVARQLHVHLGRCGLAWL